MKNDYSIRVLHRAAMILNCFTLSEPEKSLVQLASETGLHKSTVFRIMETLEGIQWVRKDPFTGIYRLGFAVFELGARAVQGLDLYKASSSHLEKLVKKTGQSAHLVIHDQGEALYLNKVESPGAYVALPSQIGIRFPMHCTAVGKVLLSYLDEKEVERIIREKGLNKVTPKTISQKEDLMKEIRLIRERGYAFDNEEIHLGLKCVAAPIRDYTGKVIAAASVTGLSSNFSEKRLPSLIEAVVSVAKDISESLGYRNNYIRDSRI